MKWVHIQTKSLAPVDEKNEPTRGLVKRCHSAGQLYQDRIVPEFHVIRNPLNQTEGSLSETFPLPRLCPLKLHGSGTFVDENGVGLGL
jgi:hypothetical protein